MKRINVKKLSLAAGVLFATNMVFGANALTEFKAKAEDHFIKNRIEVGVDLQVTKPAANIELNKAEGAVWSDIKGVYAYNKAGIHYYSSAVIIDQHKVAGLKEDLRVARKNNDKTEKAIIKRKLKKAKLDLFRDQLHLIVNKEALRQDYFLTIEDQRKELAADRQDLCKAKADAKKDKNNGYALTRVEMKKKEVKADQLAIANEKCAMKKDMADADKILKQ